MPTREYAERIYPRFGVKRYHDAGHFGAGVSIYIIDTGLTNASGRLGPNVKSRTITNAMAPKHTHGSFVASIVAARTESTPDKVPGVAPGCQVYLADVSDDAGVIYTSALVKAIKDAIELRVDIISISLGTSVYDQRLEDCVAEAARLGILLFAASGNCSCRAYEFPAACDGAISVASMDLALRPSPFNTRNDAVAVFAPGQNIAVPAAGGSLKRLSGTSFAVPFASAVAALELSARRAMDPKASLQRHEAIGLLRGLFGLSCESHTYARDVCSGRQLALGAGSFRSPSETAEGLSWFLMFATLLGALALCVARFRPAV